MTTPLSLTFIGLGVMGYPMAGHWSQTPHRVRVYNRTASKAQQWAAEYTGDTAHTLEDAVSGAHVVALCVGNDHDVWQVLDAIIPHLKAGAVVIDHTTTSADLARRAYHRLAERSVGFVDAPVSGGERGAQTGQLTIMCGGDAQVIEAMHPIMNHYAQHIAHMGPAGMGQTTKMVNQICIAGLVQGLAEGVHFAQQAGLDVNAVVDVISKGAAGSWQMVNRAHTMDANHYDHGFAVDWMRKDLNICLNAAQAMGVSLPVTALVDQFYQDVQSMGGGRWDTSSLLARLHALKPIAPHPMTQTTTQDEAEQ